MPFDCAVRQSSLSRSVSHAVDAVIFVCRDSFGWQDIYHLTGLMGTSAALLLSSDGAELAVDSRYIETASSLGSCRVLPASEVRRASPLDTVLALAASRGYTRIGVAAGAMPHSAFISIASSLPYAELVDISAFVYAARRKKSPEELACIKRAVSIASDSYRSALASARPGMSERKFAATLLSGMIDRGGDIFDQVPIIVASGPNSSRPHSFPTDRRFQPGDLVMVDISARYRGYVCDMTRMFSIGAPSQEIMNIYTVLAWAQMEAMSRVRAGAAARDVDRAARSVLISAELAPYFTHSSGHGIGLAIHEHPSISDSSETILCDGDVITVEPGVYRAGEFGMRIEDDMQVTRTGAVCLTDGLSRELQIV